MGDSCVRTCVCWWEGHPQILTWEALKPPKQLRDNSSREQPWIPRSVAGACLLKDLLLTSLRLFQPVSILDAVWTDS